MICRGNHACRATLALGIAFSLTLVTGFAAAGENPSEVDASSEPECPAGWYCARDAGPEPDLAPEPRMAVSAPARHYPVGSVLARAGWIPMPAEASDEALLLGGGVAFRYRPAGMLALEVGPDFFVGRDLLGRPRTEFSTAASLVLFGAPRSAPGPFVSMGPNLSFGWVDRLPSPLMHLGAHLGLGANLPLGERTLALLQVEAFVRGRIGARDVPEYRDPLTGSPSDADMGGVLRVGFGFDLATPG